MSQANNFIFVPQADLVGPFSQAGLKRNPAAKNSGKLMTLADFLAFSKSSNVSGILVDIRVRRLS
jgi:hypothetical protein